jgi:hypothetical protein
MCDSFRRDRGLKCLYLLDLAFQFLPCIQTLKHIASSRGGARRRASSEVSRPCLQTIENGLRYAYGVEDNINTTVVSCSQEVAMERQVTRTQDPLLWYMKIVDEPGGFLRAANRTVHLELVN